MLLVNRTDAGKERWAAQHDARSCTACCSHRTITLKTTCKIQQTHSSVLSQDPVSKPRNINAAKQTKLMNAQHTTPFNHIELAAVSRLTPHTQTERSIKLSKKLLYFVRMSGVAGAAKSLLAPPSAKHDHS